MITYQNYKVYLYLLILTKINGMTEEFLHFIWKNRLFNNINQVSLNNEKVEILNIGQHNTNAGPDFFNAQIKIDDTVWAGNVEIHLNASDWIKHNHHKDKAYDNVILHVIQTNDAEIKQQNGEKITTIKLKFDEKLLINYQSLLNQQLWIPCQNYINEVDKFTIYNFLNRLLINRLENKSKDIENKLNDNNNDWHEVSYQQIAKGFGYNINSYPFELLAKSLPIKYLAKHSGNLTQIEAMIFGQAGMLNETIDNDDYYNELKKEYTFFKNKFNLTPIDKHLWKYLRLRPCNFPTIRLSQFAALIYNSTGLFSKIIDSKNIEDISLLFSKIKTSEYWNTHYLFNKQSPKRKKTFGSTYINLILINTVVPLTFIYGKMHDNENLMNKAISYLEQLESENNSIITGWAKIGIVSDNAYYSQALIELKNNFCNKKNCLQCIIGNKLITREDLIV